MASLSTGQSPSQPYQPPQPSWWSNGLPGVHGGRRNSHSNYSLADIEDSLYNRTTAQWNSSNQTNTNAASSSTSTNYYNPSDYGQTLTPRPAPYNDQNIVVPTIQIDPVGTYSPTGSQPPIYSYPGGTGTGGVGGGGGFHRARSNSQITANRNKLRIMAMLDDVRKKRELRDRRKSDIMTYLDDLIVPDDPALANAAAGTLKLYRRRFKIYQFLNHPSTGTPWSITYHVMVFVIVFVCLILTICATIQQSPLQEKATKSVYMLEKVVVVWFNIEFALGLWSCACKRRYRGIMGKVRYLTVPSRLIDLVILSFTTIVLVFNPSKTGHEVFVVSAFRGFHRFFQVAQVLTLNRPLKPWKVLASVIYDQREQLFIIYYTEFIVLCVLAYVAFLVERETNDNFNSIADAMWWAIVTLSTVGYGDRVPVTWVGKIISTLFTILGVAIFALPAGIIGTGLALKIEEVERNNIRSRKKIAAARLIQRAWRAWKAHTTYELVSKFFRERPMPIYKQHDYLSMAQKFIALVQFYIALNKFRELLRPVDFKTVIQTYSDGQTEVLLRTKLVQQSIEELARRIEMTDNRVANMSMRIETKQNTFDRRIDHIRHLMESCHRQLLANHLLVELLRTATNTPNNNAHNHSSLTRSTTTRKHRAQSQTPSLTTQQRLQLSNNSGAGSGAANRPKTSCQNNQVPVPGFSKQPTNSTNKPQPTIEDYLLKHQQLQQAKAPPQTHLPQQTSTNNKQQQAKQAAPKNQCPAPNINLYPITSSGSNSSLETDIMPPVGEEDATPTPLPPASYQPPSTHPRAITPAPTLLTPNQAARPIIWPSPTTHQQQPKQPITQAQHRTLASYWPMGGTSNMQPQPHPQHQTTNQTTTQPQHTHTQHRRHSSYRSRRMSL